MWEKKSSRESDRLRARRRRNRRRAYLALAFLGVLVFGAFVWFANESYVRVATIEIRGGDQALAEEARATMEGKYLWLIPRDSIFFVPERAMRATILEHHPEIAAVSISGTGLTSVAIKVISRVPVARWCGLSKTPEPVEEYCYVFDVSGYVYAAASVASTTRPLYAFSIYDHLAGDTEEPLRATLLNAAQWPRVFDFARQLSMLGSPVETITMRDDEVSLVLASGTRVTYVRGEEEKAFAALMSAKQNLNFSDGSLEYVDVRFDGKVYLKKKE